MCGNLSEVDSVIERCYLLVMGFSVAEWILTIKYCIKKNHDNYLSLSKTNFSSFWLVASTHLPPVALDRNSMPMTINVLVLHLILISVDSSNLSLISSSDESALTLHNTFGVAVNVSSAFVTRWVHINRTIMFCSRSATHQKRLQWLQVMNFFPIISELTFFLHSVHRFC